MQSVRVHLGREPAHLRLAAHTFSGRSKFSTHCLQSILFALLSPVLAKCEEKTLTEAAAVLALPTDVAAQHVSVELSGVVTVAEPDWKGRFFVQDLSGG